MCHASIFEPHAREFFTQHVYFLRFIHRERDRDRQRERRQEFRNLLKKVRRGEPRPFFYEGLIRGFCRLRINMTASCTTAARPTWLAPRQPLETILTLAREYNSYVGSRIGRLLPNISPRYRKVGPGQNLSRPQSRGSKRNIYHVPNS